MINMINGQLAACDNLELVRVILSEPNSNAKVIFVGDPVGFENIIRYYDMIVGSIIMPNYQAMEADVNGDLQEFTNLYYQYLSTSQAPVQFFATILAALVRGKNIVLYFPAEARGLRYPMALLNYITNTFGIYTRNGEVPFNYDMRYNPANAALLYQYNLISPGEYIAYSGAKYTMMLDKLSADYNFKYTNPQQIIQYLNAYLNTMDEAGKVLLKPFVVGDLNADSN